VTVVPVPNGLSTSVVLIGALAILAVVWLCVMGVFAARQLLARRSKRRTGPVVDFRDRL